MTFQLVRPRPSGLNAWGRRLAGWVDPLTARVREPELAWLASRELRGDHTAGIAATLVEAARASIEARASVELRAEGLRTAAAAAGDEGRREVLARHIRATVESPVERLRDLRALDRDLDLAALLEREAEHIERHGARLEVAIKVLCGLTVEQLPADAFEQTGALALMCEVATEDPRAPTRRAAVGALAGSLAQLLLSGEVPSPEGLRVLQGIARDPAEDPWCRRAALGVVRGLEGPIALRWIEHALDDANGREAWLVRGRALELLLASPNEREPRTLEVAARHLGDPAELVRFELAEGLGHRWRLGDEEAGALLLRLMSEHPDPRTRARAVVAAGPLALADLAVRIGDVPFVAKFALQVILATGGIPLPAELVEALERLSREGPPALARPAALALSQVAPRSQEIAELARDLRFMPTGTSRTVALPPGADAVGLATALLPAAAEGHGFALEPTGSLVRVRRGDALRPRLWRILHEFRHPGPTKRQTVSHALGRADLGPIRVPPAKLADESGTGVPGERVRVGREDGWGPGLPGVDAYLHALNRGQVTVVAPEGVTTIEPPASFRGRMRARVQTTWRYAAFDALRTACLAEEDPKLRGRYVAAFAALGYRTATTALLDGPWSAYYAVSLVDPVAYVVSLRSNSLAHLSLVVLLLALILVARITTVQASMRRARQRIPLALGGWGTRGKSGTERLKAGMLEGLGIPILSKTTGCEAMVLHGPPGGHAMELFLFRPYDRATIWEQVDVVRLGPRLDARALLWECMALNPLYVDLLQTRWMKDDLSTITNAYPDHEDVMGPTGMDVAKAIGGFSPRDATVFTTEENMFAALDDVAQDRGARLVQVARAERELVPTELLDRMPHVEHPANVALAAAVGEALGVPRVEAIGLMGEHVVPDLGALSITPPARHIGREVTFVNGMSANDTLSFRHNWQRAGFLTHDHDAQPSTWLVTVINNRADRVARSRVFAQVVVEDAAAHRHVLIGTNVRGFMNYVDDAVQVRLASTVLGTPEKVAALFAHLRIVDPARLGQECAERLGVSADLRDSWRRAVEALPAGTASWSAAQRHAEQVRPAAKAMEDAATNGAGLADALVAATARASAYQAALTAPEAEIRALYADLARSAVVVVDDPGSTGDQTQWRAITACPPGAVVRIMGVQNIKGTGLDFAYQWVYWRELAKGLLELLSDQPERRRRGLTIVEANPFGSALACDEALDALRRVQTDATFGARIRRQIDRIEHKRADLVAARGRTTAKKGWLAVFLGPVERLLDPFDAIWRRRRARLVFRDLCDRRISHSRAQAWLQYLTKRQKGGWLGRPRGL
jgi:poly-gamma-glutamate synthase PgsB/CapB